MSIPEVYITTGIHLDGLGGDGKTPATIRTQLTQFTGLKVTVPKRGMRSCDVQTNLYNAELAPLYTGIGFKTHANFLHVKWRGHVVFWGHIITKEVDFENNTITLNALDMGVRLEHHYFRLGDEAMDVPAKPLIGHLPIGFEGLRLSVVAGDVPVTIGKTYIPLGIRMGTDSHTPIPDPPKREKIERSQEVWRTMQELGDRSNGPLFELQPLPVTDPDMDFAELNAFGPYFRDVISDTVKFHYGTGWNNVRNMKWMQGGLLLSHVHAVTSDLGWRTTTYSSETGNKYGVWIQWEAVPFDIDENTNTEADAEEALGSIGDSLLDEYGRPETNNQVEVTLRRDDQIYDDDNQFYWMDDYKVGDVVEVHGIKGQESYGPSEFSIEEVRLEQESDNSGQVRQVIVLLPHFEIGDYTYGHATAEFSFDDEGEGSP